MYEDTNVEELRNPLDEEEGKISAREGFPKGIVPVWRPRNISKYSPDLVPPDPVPEHRPLSITSSITEIKEGDIDITSQPKSHTSIIEAPIEEEEPILESEDQSPRTEITDQTLDTTDTINYGDTQGMVYLNIFMLYNLKHRLAGLSIVSF